MDFEQIEDAIINEIKDNIDYVRTVETYAGQLEARIEELPILYPAIFTTYSGSQYEWVDGNNYNEKDVFTVIVASKNLMGHKVMLKGSSGCYKMIKDVLSKITGNNFGLDIERMKPRETRLLYISQTIALYGIEFQTNFDKAYS